VKCDPRLLSAFRDGELDRTRAVEVEQHLEQCAACRATLAAYEHIGQSIRDLPYQIPPPSLRYRVLSQLPTEQPWRTGRRSFWKPLVEIAGLSVVTIGLILVFTTLFRGMNEARQVFASASGPFDQQTDVPPTSKIEVEFNREVDRQTVETALSIEPETKASLNWEGNKLVIEPIGGLDPRTPYTVTIKPTVKDTKGNRMSSPLVIRFTTGGVTSPTWLVDRIGFLRNGDLWTMNVDGTEQKRLTQGEKVRVHAWSPSGKMVAYLSETAAGAALKLIPGEGQSPLVLAKEVTTFRWSPDGRYLVYLTGAPDQPNGAEMWSVEARAGASPTLIESNVADTPDLTLVGQRLVYAKSGAEQGIWISEFDGKGRQRIAIDGHNPVWSPDGKMLAFVQGQTVGQVGGGARAQGGIFVISANGQELRRLTADGENPRWSPDGKLLLFDRVDGNRRSVWVLTVTDAKERKLTDGAGATWSPDGQVVAYEEIGSAGISDGSSVSITAAGSPSIAIIGVEDRKQRSLVADASAPVWIAEQVTTAPTAPATPIALPSPGSAFSPGVPSPTAATPAASATPASANPTPTAKPTDAVVSLWVTVDPQEPAVVYLATSDGALCKSRDAGNFWQRIGAGLPEDALGSTGLVVDPQISNILYLVGNRGVYRSSDGGENWYSISKALPLGDSGTGPVVAIVVDPRNHSMLYVALADGTLFKTGDAGATWQKLAPMPVGIKIRALAVHPNSGVIYAGTDSGVLISSDGGASWRRSGAELGPVLSMTFEPSAATLYAGTQEKGIFKSTDGGDSWMLSAAGLPPAPVRQVIVGPKVSLALTGLDGSRSGRALYRSTDNGASWSLAGDTGGGEISSAAMAKDGKTIYATARGALYRSTDGGLKWQAVGLQTAPTVTPSAGLEVSGVVVAVSRSARTIDLRADDGAVWSIALDILGRQTAIFFPNGASASLEDISEGLLVKVNGTAGTQPRTLLARSINIVPSARPTPAPSPTPQLRVAYIRGDSAAFYTGDWPRHLEARGFAVTEIDAGKKQGFDLSGYDLLVIGYLAGNEPKENLDQIAGAKVPVLLGHPNLVARLGLGRIYDPGNPARTVYGKSITLTHDNPLADRLLGEVVLAKDTLYRQPVQASGRVWATVTDEQGNVGAVWAANGDRVYFGFWMSGEGDNHNDNYWALFDTSVDYLVATRSAIPATVVPSPTPTKVLIPSSPTTPERSSPTATPVITSSTVTTATAITTPVSSIPSMPTGVSSSATVVMGTSSTLAKSTLAPTATGSPMAQVVSPVMVISNTAAPSPTTRPEPTACSSSTGQPVPSEPPEDQAHQPTKGE